MMNDNIKNIINQLFNEIGIAVDVEYRIIDQDFFKPLQINGKILKFGFTNEVDINPAYEIVFDPINDTKHTQMIFNYYLNKLKILGEISGYRYIPILDQVTNKIYINLDIYNNEISPKANIISQMQNIKNYTSHKYKLETLGYLDLIININNDFNKDAIICILKNIDEEINHDIY